MGVTQILLCASALLMQIHFGNSIRRSFGSSVAVVGDGFGSVGVINQGNGIKVVDNGNVKVFDGSNKVVVIGDDAGVKVHSDKGGEKVKVIEGGTGKNVVYFGDDGGSVVVVGDNGGSVGMIGGGVGGISSNVFGGNGRHFSSVGVFNGGNVVSTGGAVSVGGPGGISIASPGFVKGRRVSASPFGTGAFAGTGVNGISAYQDANSLLNFVTSATGMGVPSFWPL